MVNNPYQQYSQQYKQQSVMSMTAVEMLTALYDAAMKDFELAKIANEKNDIRNTINSFISSSNYSRN